MIFEELPECTIPEMCKDFVRIFDENELSSHYVYNYTSTGIKFIFKDVEHYPYDFVYNVTIDVFKYTMSVVTYNSLSKTKTRGNKVSKLATMQKLIAEFDHFVFWKM